MKSRPSFFRRLWQKIAGRRKPAPPVQPPRGPAERERAGIEPLEGRIAPATLVSATVVSFTDLDGDAVTIRFSEPLFDPAKSIAENRLNDVFKLDRKSVV